MRLTTNFPSPNVANPSARWNSLNLELASTGTGLVPNLMVTGLLSSCSVAIEAAEKTTSGGDSDIRT